MATNSPFADVAVVGAGPAGCVTALAFARRGAQVLLLEAQPKTPRLAGEWLHPPGVEVLRRLGIGPIPAASGHPPALGFAVFPHDNSRPIVLKYPRGKPGLTCEHQALVGALREAAASHPNVRFQTCSRVAGIDGQCLNVENTEGAATDSVWAKLIVGADGRSSLTRRCLGLPDDRTLISHMAGVLLEDVELPFEGFGHVCLAGAGPMFVARISRRHVRICLDVPVRYQQQMKDPDFLWDAYHPALPPTLRPAFRAALRDRPITGAANQLRPRVHYGREGLALVGDAVGHFHPLTAVGMTLGFLDGYCLANSRNFAEYYHRRFANTHVPELLSMGLYQVFTTQDDEGLVAMRQAVYRVWRQSKAERRRTIHLLSGEETDLVRFNRAFLKVMALAARDVLEDAVLAGQWRQTGRALHSFGEWLFWLAAGTLPRLIRHPYLSY